MRSLRFSNPFQEFHGAKSIPERFLNFIKSIDEDRVKIMKDLGIMDQDVIKPEYHKSDTYALSLWRKLSDDDRKKYLQLYKNKYQDHQMLSYLLTFHEAVLGEVFFNYLEKKINRDFLVEIFGEELGGEHFWDNQSPLWSLEQSFMIYDRMDPSNRTKFERAVEKSYLDQIKDFKEEEDFEVNLKDSLEDNQNKKL